MDSKFVATAFTYCSDCTRAFSYFAALDCFERSRNNPRPLSTTNTTLINSGLVSAKQRLADDAELDVLCLLHALAFVEHRTAFP